MLLQDKCCDKRSIRYVFREQLSSKEADDDVVLLQLFDATCGISCFLRCHCLPERDLSHAFAVATCSLRSLT